MTPSISVIIPAFDHVTEVLACLTSLQAFASKTVAIEFLVSDDCSPNAFFPALIPHCAAKVIRRSENGGFGANANTGASFAEGDIIFFCNQDILAIGLDADGQPLSQDWDIHLVNAFTDPVVGVVGAKLLFPDGRIQNAGGQYDGRCGPYHIGLGYSNHRYEEVNTPREVSWSTAAALGIRRDLFNQLGGFDLAYSPSYFEDTDLCARAREAGYKVWYEPRCALVHHVGTSGGSKYFQRSAKTFYDKWVVTKRIKPDIQALKVQYW